MVSASLLFCALAVAGPADRIRIPADTEQIAAPKEKGKPLASPKPVPTVPVVSPCTTTATMTCNAGQRPHRLRGLFKRIFHRRRGC